ncbi:SDR family oxidoreductase [Thermocrinis minervae]|uniref:NAD(P)-dependent dehydrogenase, short-chain alcohol dehydrogenase family n=1 Tax=Thermocrinis minervae TaxID=381751 RepID=A0A1M6Q6A0_9AQUI|nr:SDR family oxidoreductase [Thermocrinis minervae]SHK15731.1 NAD(P)-dependent dehydrogenase, short-chain alcohol dehydrogenase family [Thermocrinis minervae]
MKTVLITGIRRIGFEIAKYLLEKGYDLIVYYKESSDKARELEGYARKLERIFQAYKVDLNDLESVSRITKEVTEKFAPDAFIHVAGPYFPTPFKELSLEALHLHFTPTVEAFLEISKILSEGFLKKEGQVKGRIVAFGDWAVDTPYKNYVAYFVSKGALHTAVKVLARELAPHVLVNCIALGPTLKPDDFTQERWEDYIRRTPLKRSVSLKDVVELTYFLMNVESMTGEIINLDSGRHIAGECG